MIKELYKGLIDCEDIKSVIDYINKQTFTDQKMLKAAIQTTANYGTYLASPTTNLRAEDKMYQAFLNLAFRIPAGMPFTVAHSTEEALSKTKESIHKTVNILFSILAEVNWKDERLPKKDESINSLTNDYNLFKFGPGEDLNFDNLIDQAVSCVENAKKSLKYQAFIDLNAQFASLAHDLLNAKIYREQETFSDDGILDRLDYYCAILGYGLKQALETKLNLYERRMAYEGYILWIMFAKAVLYINDVTKLTKTTLEATLQDDYAKLTEITKRIIWEYEITAY